ncbi:hypothetical protein F5X99DRAFT_385612 [Biscogniauxia marginata]|nr:hypothetical protein F5X99DRAFT_385612 [Biscogniauxia marginata]
MAFIVEPSNKDVALHASSHCCPPVDMSSGTAPGKRCPTCQANGSEVWVLPGRCCGYCGTYVG